MKNRFYANHLFLFLALFSGISFSTAQTNEQLVAYNDHFTTVEGANGFIYVISNDIDPENNIDTASLTIVSPTSHGSVEIYPDGKVYYTPYNGYDGPDSFVYSICDNGSPSTCAQGSVSITVNDYTAPQNQIVVNDDHVTTFMNEFIDIEVMFNDLDIDGGVPLDSLGITETAENGITVINYSTGKIRYTPNTGFLGIDTFYYKSCDLPYEDWDLGPIVTCAEGMVTVRVIPNNLSVSTYESIEFNAFFKDGSLILQSEEELYGELYVYALNGHLLLNEKIAGEIPFDPVNGIYSVVLETDKGIATTKIVQTK